MSNNKDTTDAILTDVFGRNPPDLSRFGDGASSLAQVQKSLRQRDDARDEQNEAAQTGGPVTRDR